MKNILSVFQLLPSLPKVQSIIAPIAAPLPPAVMLGSEIFGVMIGMGVPKELALFTSTAGVVGIDFTGALMCYNAIKAWRRKSYALMIVAIAGALVYATIVIFALATMPEGKARALAFLVLIGLVSFLGLGMFSSFEDETEETEAKVEQDIRQTREKKNFLNAQTRNLKAQAEAGTVQSNVQSVQLNIEQANEQAGPVITELGRRIIADLETNGTDRSLRAIAKSVGGCSPATVKTWLNYYKKGVE